MTNKNRILYIIIAAIMFKAVLNDDSFCAILIPTKRRIN